MIKSAVFITVQHYASTVYVVVVCPSVCPPVTRLHCTERAKCRITQTMPYDSPGTLVFGCQKSQWNSDAVTPDRGAKRRWGRFK